MTHLLLEIVVGFAVSVLVTAAGLALGYLAGNGWSLADDDED